MLTEQISLADIKIRTELLPGDLGYIAYLHGLLYAEEFGYGFNFEAYVLGGLQEFARQYDRAKDRVWVCLHNDKSIGFLVAVHRNDIVQFRYFIFLPEYRGIGLGKRLMDEFIGYMKECGCNKTYLWTTNEQQVAISLYTRYGFKLTEEKQSYVFDKPLTELRFDLEL